MTNCRGGGCIGGDKTDRAWVNGQGAAARIAGERGRQSYLCRAAGMNPAARLLGRVLSARAGQYGRTLDITQAWQHPGVASRRADSHARAAAGR